MTKKSIEARALDWSTGGDTGSSSKMILRVMTGHKPNDTFAHPHDFYDLGRCLRLLALIPEWRPRIGEMAPVSKEWAALAAIWPELEALHKAGDPRKTYDRMQAILRPIEDERGDIIRLGDNASIRFGRAL